jgi:hypothetical protein
MFIRIGHPILHPSNKISTLSHNLSNDGTFWAMQFFSVRPDVPLDGREFHHLSSVHQVWISFLAWLYHKLLSFGTGGFSSVRSHRGQSPHHSTRFTFHSSTIGPMKSWYFRAGPIFLGPIRCSVGWASVSPLVHLIWIPCLIRSEVGSLNFGPVFLGPIRCWLKWASIPPPVNQT